MTGTIGTIRGYVEFGEIIRYDIYDGTLRLGSGFLSFDINAQDPSLR
jgi:hypothetical protein